ncbi:MAG: YebC/PmpR family DNA-binding transcriptional regulator [Parcubacteria group bacterium]
MSGHNKWSSIKHKKGINDQKRSKIFSKFAKLIAIAARDGADLEKNMKLKAVIDQARSFNMPKDNIDRAIKKASDKDASQLKEVTIQAIGPESVAIVIEAVTDNTNRTISELKNILFKHNAKMAEPNSLNWMFKDKKPLYPVTPQNDSTNKQLEALFEELDDHDDVNDIYSNLSLPEMQG